MNKNSENRLIFSTILNPEKISKYKKFEISPLNIYSTGFKKYNSQHPPINIWVGQINEKKTNTLEHIVPLPTK